MENQNNNTGTTSAGQAMGIVALVLGVLGAIAAFIPCFGAFAILFGALAIIFGAVGFVQAKKGNGGKGLPLAGLILGIAATVFTVIWIMVVAAKVKGAAEEFKNELEKTTKELQTKIDSTQQQMQSATDSLNKQ